MHPALHMHVVTQQAQQAAIFAHHHALGHQIHAHLALARSHQFAAFRANVIVVELTPEFLSALGASSKAENLLLFAQGEHIRVHPHHNHEAQEIIQALPVALRKVRYVGRRDYIAVGEGSMPFVSM